MTLPPPAAAVVDFSQKRAIFAPKTYSSKFREKAQHDVIKNIIYFLLF
jgi:hypothetical protein